MWALFAGWFTPSVLFVFLNLTIGTIAVASTFGKQKNEQQQRGPDNPPRLARSPSLLERFKSFNFSVYRSEEPYHFPSVTTAIQPSATETQQKFDETRVSDENLEKAEENIHVTRTKSETKPASGEVPAKLPKKLKKSASINSAFGHYGEEEIEVDRLRPASVREKKSKVSEMFGEDEEVDAKADDFINRFKNQLKLQRLDSILRYKEMLSRGSAK